ncbi:MAG: hypothetical protein QGH25_12715, partial [Candidatus Latescibacteria bacterium]|nr:hypothetical protein [Candidatus Latescibacterota bacterium]
NKGAILIWCDDDRALIGKVRAAVAAKWPEDPAHFYSPRFYSGPTTGGTEAAHIVVATTAFPHIAEEYRAKGFAVTVLDDLVAEAQQEGANEMHVLVFTYPDDNARSDALRTQARTHFPAHSVRAMSVLEGMQALPALLNDDPQIKGAVVARQERKLVARLQAHPIEVLQVALNEDGTLSRTDEDEAAVGVDPEIVDSILGLEDLDAQIGIIEGNDSVPFLVALTEGELAGKGRTSVLDALRARMVEVGAEAMVPPETPDPSSEATSDEEATSEDPTVPAADDPGEGLELNDEQIQIRAQSLQELSLTKMEKALPAEPDVVLDAVIAVEEALAVPRTSVRRLVERIQRQRYLTT